MIEIRLFVINLRKGVIGHSSTASIPSGAIRRMKAWGSNYRRWKALTLLCYCILEDEEGYMLEQSVTMHYHPNNVEQRSRVDLPLSRVNASCAPIGSSRNRCLHSLAARRLHACAATPKPHRQLFITTHVQPIDEYLLT